MHPQELIKQAQALRLTHHILHGLSANGVELRPQLLHGQFMSGHPAADKGGVEISHSCNGLSRVVSREGTHFKSRRPT